MKGTFQGNTLVVNLLRPVTVTYQTRPDAKLDAKYEWQAGMARAVMTKVIDAK